ncbi:hypothetical protein M407DRAFT_21246 [Tulasnella calospora MUT 4182]|uniref:Cytochrome P450 n=1 Tax=Tulasnella calospora MUT 4182 TaxID=1051891 RepID=A0A0C3QQ84_9AGAM|nr:hypothetical protein M407DRAFT_21246 [Tulasnella calospora MUT 4182]
MAVDLLSSSNASFVASGLVLAYLFKKYWDGRSHPPYPPGPPGLPVIGNLLDMPRTKFVMGFLEWGRQYGPVTWAVVPGRKFLILNSYEAISELLDKRGNNYINRPVGVMANKIVGTGFSTGRLQGDATWRKHRKFLRQALSMSTVKQEYSDLFVASATRYLQAILLSPGDFLPRLKRILGETITELTYGALEDENGTDYVTEHNENLNYTVKVAMGYLVDLFPLLRFVPAWFPGAQFQRDASKWRQHCIMVRKLMIDGVEKRMAAKEGRACYVSNILEDLQGQQATKEVDLREDVQAVHDSGFSFFQAGADTTETTVKNFLLAMSLYPDVQARARKEVDQFFTEGRSPDFESQDQMPYIEAVVLESLRWNPPLSFGIPHASREDDVYNGYFIPKGTSVIANQWQVSRDPSIYEDPSTFNPDRFIDNPNILDPRDFVFGFGRRICPGNALGYQLSWIFVVSILWGFEIKRPEGCPPLEHDADRFDFGLVNAPYPFPCDFIPRDDFAKSNAQ